MKARRALLAVTALAVASAAGAADDLMAVFQLAQQADPRYQAAKAAYQATREQRPQAFAQLWLPDIRLEGETMQNRQDIRVAPGAFGGNAVVWFNSRALNLSVTQPIYHFDRWMALKQLDDRIRQAELEVAAEHQDLMVRVAERYFDLLAAGDNLEFARAEKLALSRQLEQARQRFEVGLVAITDVQEAQAGYDSAVAQEIAAVNALDNAVEALREVTGRHHDALAPLTGELPLTPPDPEDIEAWTEAALAHNIRLAAELAGTEAAEKEIRRQYAGHLPQIDVVGGRSLSHSGGRFGAVDITADSLGVQMNLPLYQGGQVVSRTREAQLRHREALDRLEQTRRSVVRTARAAYLGVMSGISRVRALQQAVVSSQTALTATRAGFEVGTRTSVDVVDAERQLFRARRDLARARYDYILDTIRLKQAAGSLSPRDLALVNGWLAGGTGGRAGPPLATNDHVDSEQGGD